MRTAETGFPEGLCRLVIEHRFLLFHSVGYLDGSDLPLQTLGLVNQHRGVSQPEPGSKRGGEMFWYQCLS